MILVKNSRLINILILVLCVSFSYAQRYEISFNENWRFFKGDTLQVLELGFDDSKWKKVHLPHTWNKQDALNDRNYYRGVAWYRKGFNVQNTTAGTRTFVRFEGALMRSEVFVNGKLAGIHEGGYSAFTVDITELLIPDSRNLIAVKVDNSPMDIPPLSGDFTLWGGIYRDVWLVQTAPVHFDMLNHGSKGVFIKTPEVSEKQAKVSVNGTFINHTSQKQKLRVVSVIEDPSGKKVTEWATRIMAAPGVQTAFNQLSQPIINPALWSPDRPNLYRITTKLVDEKSGQQLDEVINPLGFRWYRFDADSGFYLNGQPLKLVGVCRHQDFEGLGSALTDEMHRRDMQLIKDMGMNFIRISHYPQDDAVLEACDRLGLVVWEEIPIVDMVSENPAFFDVCKNNLLDMIRQHYNHPSVMMWGYMNEAILGTVRKIPAEKQPLIFEKTVELSNQLHQLLKQEDPARYSVFAQHGDAELYQKLGLSDIVDIVGWNLYQGWYGGPAADFGKFIDAEHKKFPQRVHIISEYGAGSDVRVHSTQPECFDFSTEYQQLYHEALLPQILERRFIAGSALWNLIDFGSAIRDESMPRINNKGLIYYNRVPKDVYFYHKAMLSKQPVLHIASRDWVHRAGIIASNQQLKQPVKIYANVPEVELWVNGVSQGIKKVENCTAVWDVPFIRGNNIVETTSRYGDQLLRDVLMISMQTYPEKASDLLDNFELAVNVGSTAFFTDDKSGLIWLPDRSYTPGSWGYVGGEIYRLNPWRLGIQVEVQGTRNQPLYQTFNAGLEAYRFDVSDGLYELELHFADPGEKRTELLNDVGSAANTVKKASTFNVLVNGKTVISNFSPAREYGVVTAAARKLVVKASNNQGINVSFKAIEGLTLLNGIKLRKL